MPHTLAAQPSRPSAIAPRRPSRSDAAPIDRPDGQRRHGLHPEQPADLDGVQADAILREQREERV